MNFNEYTAARRSKKWGIAVDEEAITRFASRQPTACPACGAQVFDPFGMGVVIHDVAQCAEKRPNAELSGPRPLAAEGSRSNDGLGAERPGKETT